MPGMDHTALHKFYFSEHDRAVLARDKTVTFVLSTEKLNGTFAVGVVHDSPEYQHIKITQLLKRGSSGEHPRKKDFSRSEDPVFEVWTDRIKKEDVSYTDVQVGKDRVGLEQLRTRVLKNNKPFKHM